MWNDITLPSGGAHPSCQVSEAALRWRDMPIPYSNEEEGDCSFLFCITLYNEISGLLQDSLYAIANNLMELTALGKKPTSTVCIMVDGYSCMHENTRTRCRALGFALPSGLDTLVSSDNPQLWMEWRSIALDELKVWCGRSPMAIDRDKTIRILMSVKPHNMGKLDSHAWFFRKILPSIQASYVVQLDVGSQLAPQCLTRLWRHMEHHPCCAALAPNVATDAAHPWFDLLQTWQYFDFLTARIIDYPLPSLIGHLELLPGQCTLFRRSALIPQDAGDQCGILVRYLAGVNASGWLGTTAFLTEDRVIGHDLMLGQSATKRLSYAINAHVHTDRCGTAGELLSQRRRWRNGTLACRLYALRYLSSYVRAPHLPWALRLTVPLIQLIDIIQTAASLLYPWLFAMLASYAAVVASHVVGYRQEDIFVAASAALVFLSQWIWIGCWPHPRPGRLHLPFPATIITLSIQITVALVVLALASPHDILAMGLGALGIIMAAIGVTKGWAAIHPVRFVFIYLPTCISVNLWLTAYAMRNITDLSWGTKGLNRCVPHKDRSGCKSLGAIMVWQLFTLIGSGIAIFNFSVLRSYIDAILIMMCVNIIVGAGCTLIAACAVCLRQR